MKLHVALLGWVLAAGCGPPQQMFCSGAGGFGGGGGTGEGAMDPIGVVGHPVEVVVALPLAFSCVGGNPKPDQVVVQVFDPNNQQVENTATGPVTDDFSGSRTTVRFTPSSAGSYHLTARFEPSIGRAQLDVEVAFDRSGAAITTLSLPETCDSLEQVSSGVFCKADGQLHLYRAGAQVQSWNADEFAISGNVLWVLYYDQLSRWVDTGASTWLNEPLGHASSSSYGVRTMLFGTPSEVLEVQTSSVTRHRFADGGLTDDPPLTFNSTGNLFTAYVDPSHSQALAIGTDQSCRIDFTDSGSASCETLISTPLGSDQTGIWNLEGATLRHRGFSEGFALQVDSLPLRQVPRTDLPSTHFQSAPVLWTNSSATTQLVPVLTDGGIFFEQFPQQEGFALVPFTSSQVRAQSATGVQHLFNR